MHFDRIELLNERLVAVVKAGTWESDLVQFDSLDIFKAEVEATLLPDFALSGMVAAQWLIPVENAFAKSSRLAMPLPPCLYIFLPLYYKLRSPCLSVVHAFIYLLFAV